MLHPDDLDQQLSALLAAPHWYVGFSGGVDSTVLLHLLHGWCAAQPKAPPLTAIHVNHNLQNRATAWQQHCERVCHALDVPCTSYSVDVPAAGRGEAAARNARYAVFEAQLPAAGVLFLGHHLDDQVETFFLRLMRGAGVEGLAGMPRSRALGAGLLVRPLLDWPRSAIERYAAEHQLDYVQDPSNNDTAMDRNFLRAQLLPLLDARWPRYRQSIARASRHLAVAAATIADLLGAPATVVSVLGDPGLALAPLLASSPSVAATRLRAWLRAGGYQAPDSAALSEFVRQLHASAADGNPALNCGSYKLQRYQRGVFMVPLWDCGPPTESIGLAPGESCDVPGVGILAMRPAAHNGLCLPAGTRLTVSWRRGALRCRLPGRAGQRSLKAVLQENQVPPWWRDRVPLVFLGEELLAVGDIVRCESSHWHALPPAGDQLWNFHWERPADTGSD
ncbi:MAG: tRNA lysidine(34) synthetase TilS [Halioglobus sp.]